MQSFLWINSSREKRNSLTEEAKTQVSQFDLFYNNCNDNSSIEVIRQLQQFLSRKPLQSQYNLGLLGEAQSLSLEAQNALLKTLEEPPQGSRLILIAPQVSSLLPTIVSRCQVVETSGIETNVNVDWELLKKVVSGNDSVRLKESEELDIDSWLTAWQKLLTTVVNDQKTPITINLTLKEISSYLKKLLKLSAWRENHVNSKLLASVILLATPKEEP